ncbi:MAG: GNAT family N-acetyltransferase [Betaproteobacteria bacterium]|nr:GNAT family N-acetyltransferase [Betaproteobacteria bacterium]
MQPYSEDLVRHLRLRDGTGIIIRPIRPEDAQIEQDFVRELSDEARYYRFMDMRRELSPTMLAHLTRIDYHDHMALIAVTHQDSREVEIGVARYVVNPDGTSCEFAVVVGDKWQGRGVAGLLMAQLLAAARARGLKAMIGEVLSSNHKMLRFVHGLGFEAQVRENDPTVIRITKELDK